MTRSRTSLRDSQPGSGGSGGSGDSSDESSGSKSPKEEETPSRERKTEQVDEEMTNA